MMEPMRALTLRPHWAHAVAHLGMRILSQPQSVPSSVRGQRVAIHAGSMLPMGWRRELLEASPEEQDMSSIHVLGCMPHRAIVATAVLLGGIQPSTWWPDYDWAPEWADPDAVSWWRLTDVVTLAEPIPWTTGRRGPWKLPMDVSARLREAADEYLAAGSPDPRSAVAEALD